MLWMLLIVFAGGVSVGVFVSAMCTTAADADLLAENDALRAEVRELRARQQFAGWNR